MEESAVSPTSADSAQSSIRQAYNRLRQAIKHDDGARVRRLLFQFVAVFPGLLRWQDRTMKLPPLVTLAAQNGAVKVPYLSFTIPTVLYSTKEGSYTHFLGPLLVFIYSKDISRNNYTVYG